MKKLKDLTVPVAGRISPELKQKFDMAAEDLGLSLAQYVSMMLNMAEYGETSLDDIKAQIRESLKEENRVGGGPERQQEEFWKKAPYASMLEAVFKNEGILAEMFVTNSNRPFSSNELLKNGFNYNALLQGERQGNLYYYFTGAHGWAFTDSTKQSVVIIKKG